MPSSRRASSTGQRVDPSGTHHPQAHRHGSRRHGQYDIPACPFAKLGAKRLRIQDELDHGGPLALEHRGQGPWRATSGHWEDHVQGGELNRVSGHHDRPHRAGADGYGRDGWALHRRDIRPNANAKRMFYGSDDKKGGRPWICGIF